MQPITGRLTLTLAWILMLVVSSAPQADEYGHHTLGDLTAKTPQQTTPGLLLMGGGDRNPAALRWFAEKAGGGHIVILRASHGGEIGDEFFHRIGGVTSVETFVFNRRESASDPEILARIKQADGIFIAGGDQARYVRFWRGTALAEALDAHVRAGKPLGGTSAGLAILGEYFYGAMDGGSQSSHQALADPYGERNTIETGFLQIESLAGVLTDTHFSQRDRLGRLIAFLAKAEKLSGKPMLGLGVDENATLAVDADGRARVFSAGTGAAVFLVRGGLHPQQKSVPLNLARVQVVGLDEGSVLHLPSGRVEKPAFERNYAVRGGVLTALGSPVLVIHGGAGVEPADLSEKEVSEARSALEAALRAGHAVLTQGKPALDAVSAAITLLEDAPQFNAGRGAVFTHDGRNELDSSVMDGASGKAGAVAGVQRVKNPILLARKIMDASRHVMLMGEGAEKFAEEQGIELVDAAYFRTEKRWNALQKILREEADTQARQETFSDLPGRAYFGTVGALALDAQGHLAAGTSTGGMTNKRYGRVGDSPIIGAGTWADTRCAVSGTGWGEFYIRVAAAHDVCARMAYAGDSLQQAAETVINQVIPAAGGDGGAIALGADGNMAFPFNTAGMYRGWIGSDGVPHVAIAAEDDLSLR